METSSNWTFCGAVIFLTVCTGCRSGNGIFGVDRCANVPCGAIPGKPGNHLCEWQQAQVRSASNDLGVFYQADFIGQSDRLSPAAELQVARLVQQGAVGTVPLILEPSDDSQLDASRAIMLASTFSAAGMQMSADEISVASPPALGLAGYRAQQVARAASRNGNQGGGQGQGSNGGLGGASGNGMGGGFGQGGFGGGGIF
ncbi:MAG: hypothetical protein FJ308_07670 [Planctomycetes bacterium]|nr:hypothetical protein [Planctomycetota bacterium]